jgi:hypothetical protein
LILNLRGTSGSGKTTVVRGLMGKFPIINELHGNVRERFKNKTGEGERTVSRVIGYECMPDRRQFDPGDDKFADRPNLRVVGAYKNTCGGCDGIQLQDEICRLVHEAASSGADVVFEGLLISHLFSRYRDLDRELASRGQHTIWAFFDTPLEVCLDRVRARRDERAATKGKVAGPLDVTNTTNKWYDMRRVFEKCQADKLDARWLPYQNATETAWSWIQ